MGGGVCIYYNNNSSVNFNVSINRKSLVQKLCKENIFECVVVNIKIVNSLVHSNDLKFELVCLYRPPHSKEQEFVNLLESLIHCLLKDSEYVVICGDWNVNFLNSNDPSVVKIRNMLMSFGLSELVKYATRITENRESLLDNVVTNLHSKTVSCSSFFNTLSDHDCQLITVKCNSTPSELFVKKRLFSKHNIFNFKDSLSQVDWNFLYQTNGVNNQFKSFSEIIQNSFNRSFPVKKICNKQTGKNKRQLSRELKNFADRNVDLGIMARNTKDPTLKTLLKERKKLFRRLVIQEKRETISQEVGNSDCIQRALWSVVRRETGESKPSSSLPFLKNQGIIVQSPSEVVKLFNNQFSNKFDKSQFNTPYNSCQLIQLNTPVHSLFFTPVTSREVEQAILSLKSKKSTGTDEISSFLLKQIYTVLIDPLVHLFNSSISSGIFPDIYKTSKLVPIFKKGEKSDVNNYRPVALLCTLSKVLEKLVYSRLIDHLDRYNILTHNQYGFRANHSTTQAIVDLVQEIISNLEKREPALGVFCDLSKAFDRVNHDILCEKLEKYGVRGVALAWFRSYLTNRMQFVEISGIRSEHTECKCGVPQGSILGPLLFIVYINDLAAHLLSAKCIFYADDTTLLFKGPQINMQCRVTESVQSLMKWLSINNLQLNSNKSNFMQFLTLNKSPNIITLDEFDIKECSSVKFLGITVDSRLSWFDQVTQLCGRLSCICYALRTLQPLLDCNVLLMVYYGCFFSVMTYGVEVWGGSPHASKVFLVQKRALRIISGLPPLHSCKGVFRSLDLLTLPSIYIYRTILSAITDIRDIPSVGESHRYPTRHGGDLRTPSHRLTLSERSLNFTGPFFFNKLPTEIKKSRDRLQFSCFKRLLRKYLIDNEFYSIQDFLST